MNLGGSFPARARRVRQICVLPSTSPGTRRRCEGRQEAVLLARRTTSAFAWFRKTPYFSNKPAPPRGPRPDTLKFVYGDEIIGEDDVCLTGSNNMEHNVYPARCDEKHQDWKIKRV